MSSKLAYLPDLRQVFETLVNLLSLNGKGKAENRIPERQFESDLLEEILF